MANLVLKNVSKRLNIKENSPLLALGISLLVLVMLLFVIAWPFLTIWAVNTLFGTTIVYTFKTWLACYLLLLSVQSTLRVSNKN
jgi:sterol desaturase/sphingolipid hydroxylase (fatty acid hydroxylase superfamily)